MAYNGIIFDLDGTLLDTIDDIADSFNEVLKTYGFPTHTKDQYKLFVGEGAFVCAQRVLPRSVQKQEHSIQKILSEYRQVYQKKFAQKTRLFSGMDELLTFLATTQIKLAVLSNKPHEDVSACLNHFLPNSHFCCFRGAQNGIPLKPDPTSALLIAKQFELRPDQIMLCGDSWVDMETARAAGMFGIGALWGFRSEEELINAGARILISKPKDLIPFLSGEGTFNV